jgi:hypothetical protein
MSSPRPQRSQSHLQRPTVRLVGGPGFYDYTYPCSYGYPYYTSYSCYGYPPSYF